MQLLVATTNTHKTGEIGQILGPSWEVEDLRSHPEITPAEETGATMQENAILKAVGASNAYSGVVLADDSGLEVDALDGAPGVYSARYSGPGATDASNRIKLIHELGGVLPEQRTARFRCVIAIAQSGRVLDVFEGTVEGTLLSAERGEGGFGYDPLFVPHGYGETFAELPAEVKNRESHRARAMAQAAQFLSSLA